MAMSKIKSVDDIFQKVPINEYIEENISRLPEDISPEVRQKILNDSKFFGELGMETDTPEEYVKNLEEYQNKRKALKGINKDNKMSKAYPNYDEYIHIQPQRETKKWLDAVKNMYYRIHKGMNRGQALEGVTAGWDNMEKLDFKNWLKFYEESTHKKYSTANDTSVPVKVAQIGYWQDENKAGYFIPIHKDPEPVGRAIDFAKDPETNENVKAEEKREIIEKQRNKIVSRLDSAEKLLRSHEGQIFAGKEFEALMHIIYELKKKIHTVNKISTSTKLYEDMIIREANILTRQGFNKASEILFKIAEDKTITPSPPESPLNGGVKPGNITSAGPVTSPPPNEMPGAPPPAPVVPPEKIDEGMDGFLKGMEGKKDEQTAEDSDLEVLEDESDAWVVEAQVANPEIDAKPRENDIRNSPETVNPFDKKMDQAFQGITIADVVQKLEDNTKIYKTRQMPRELSYIDMMLDHLGLASFFPTLAEATNKSLDANQYILTRLEDITSRLRGTIKTNDIDLTGQNTAPPNPEIDTVKNKLRSEQEKEKARKQMKKNLESNQLEQQSKPEPELEVEEDLGGPVQTPAPPPPPKPIQAPIR